MSAAANIPNDLLKLNADKSSTIPTVVAPGDSIKNGIVKRESNANKTQKTVAPKNTKSADSRIEAILAIQAEINAAISTLPVEYQSQVRAVIPSTPGAEPTPLRAAPTSNIAIFGGIGTRANKAPTSKYKGVGWHRRNGKWQAMIGWHGKRKHLGYFLTEEEAAMAYDSAARQVQANPILNFPTAEDIAVRGALRAVPISDETGNDANAKQIQAELVLRQQSAHQAAASRPQTSARQRATGLVRMEMNGSFELPPMPPSMSQVSSLGGLAGLNPAIAQAILTGQMNVDDVLNNPALLAQATTPLSDPSDFLAPSFDNASSSAEVPNPNVRTQRREEGEPEAKRIRTSA